MSDLVGNPEDRFSCVAAQFIWLMTCENSEILNRFAEFVHTCFSMRDTR